LVLSVSGCREEIIHNLSEQQANRLITRLDENIIESKKTRQPDGRWSVEVERNQLAQALREMQKLRLLRDERATSNEGSSVIASRDQQRFAFERALSTEIEQTLLSFEGVLEARVHLNLPQVDPLFGKAVPGVQGSGSVFIIAEQELTFSREDFANLVAGAAGMTAQGISVLIEVDQIAKRSPALEVVQDEIERSGAQDEEKKLVIASEYWRPILQNTKSIPLIAGALLVIFGAYLIRLVLKQKTFKNVIS
jgi:type III secretion protein J